MRRYTFYLQRSASNMIQVNTVLFCRNWYLRSEKLAETGDIDLHYHEHGFITTDISATNFANSAFTTWYHLVLKIWWKFWWAVESNRKSVVVSLTPLSFSKLFWCWIPLQLFISKAGFSLHMQALKEADSMEPSAEPHYIEHFNCSSFLCVYVCVTFV